MKEIPEADWQALKKMKPKALNTACQRALDKIDRIIKTNNPNAHQSFLGVWDVIQDDNEIIGQSFDDMRRSNATLKMGAMLRFGLIGQEELETLTEETRERVKVVAGANKAL